MARDIILRETTLGFLPIIESDGKQVYMGELQNTTGEALECAERALDELEIRGEVASPQAEISVGVEGGEIVLTFDPSISEESRQAFIEGLQSELSSMVVTPIMEAES